MLEPFSSPQYKKRTELGTSGDECCICGRQTSGLNGAIHVPVDHTRAEFVTEEQAKERGESVSYFPIGPECAKKWAREFKCHTTRLRWSNGKLFSYDIKLSG